MQIKKGDCLIKSKPFAYVLSSKHKDTHCDYCFKSGKLLKCSICHYVHYCDRVCQKKSWSVHKSECTNLKRILPLIIPDVARLMARIIVKLQKGGADEKDYYDKNSYRKFEDLMSHNSGLNNDQKRKEHFVSLCKVLEDYMGTDQLPNLVELFTLYGRICINSYDISDHDMNSVGVGIYLGPSIINHSCKPNAVAIFEGPMISIRAISDMPSLDWSRIHVSYIDLLKTTNARRTELQNDYFFLCECERCKEPEIFASAAVCSTCNNVLSDIMEKSCSKCGKEISSDLKQKFNRVSELTTINLIPKKNIDDLEISYRFLQLCIGEQKDVFHPLNIQHVQALDLAYDISLDLGYLEDAESFGIELLPGYLLYYGEFHPLTGLLYLHLGKIQLHLNKTKSALKTLEKAHEILRITHGDRHSLFKEHLQPLLALALIESQ